MEINISRQYYVVEFLDPPHTGFGTYVCVPDSWMGLRDVETQMAVIKYPIEDISVTSNRVISKEIFLREWPVFDVHVKFGADTYKNAKKYITFVRNITLVTKGVENIDLKTKFLEDPNSEHNITTDTNLLKQEQSETKCTAKNKTNEATVGHDLDLTNESTSKLSEKHLPNIDLLTKLKNMDSSIESRCEHIERALQEHKKQSMVIKTMIKSVESFVTIFNDFIADISQSTTELSSTNGNTDDDVFVTDSDNQNCEDIGKDRGKHGNGQNRTGTIVMKKRTRHMSSGSDYNDDRPKRNLGSQELKNPFKVPDSNVHVKTIRLSNPKKISKDSFYRNIY